jgi:ribosomal protein L30/L7E
MNANEIGARARRVADAIRRLRLYRRNHSLVREVRGVLRGT